MPIARSTLPNLPHRDGLAPRGPSRAAQSEAASPRPRSLTDLPAEILFRIYSSVAQDDWLNLAQVDRMSRDTIRSLALQSSEMKRAGYTAEFCQSVQAQDHRQRTASKLDYIAQSLSVGRSRASLIPLKTQQYRQTFLLHGDRQLFGWRPEGIHKIPISVKRPAGPPTESAWAELQADGQSHLNVWSPPHAETWRHHIALLDRTPDGRHLLASTNAGSLYLLQTTPMFSDVMSLEGVFRALFASNETFVAQRHDGSLFLARFNNSRAHEDVLVIYQRNWTGGLPVLMSAVMTHDEQCLLIQRRMGHSNSGFMDTLFTLLHRDTVGTDGCGAHSYRTVFETDAKEVKLSLDTGHFIEARQDDVGVGIFRYEGRKVHRLGRLSGWYRFASLQPMTRRPANAAFLTCDDEGHINVHYFTGAGLVSRMLYEREGSPFSVPMAPHFMLASERLHHSFTPDGSHVAVYLADLGRENPAAWRIEPVASQGAASVQLMPHDLSSAPYFCFGFSAEGRRLMSQNDYGFANGEDVRRPASLMPEWRHFHFAPERLSIQDGAAFQDAQKKHLAEASGPTKALVTYNPELV